MPVEETCMWISSKLTLASLRSQPAAPITSLLEGLPSAPAMSIQSNCT